ncbi:PQQ-dependent sugar dehydrogenase [Sphingomonas sp. AP4-R1]|uniref:PQQ-dependent sugar dehydrogenase n=1 Tax=Sphingomonas sp. AP4-R1 TaxID=2735134 RepID=UPI0014939E7E|nr:PQQ-dependent sugar dehydrogenase [Sphingomonas sp. AP4-R1]QJU57656.1 PQQ-dependent sugar dehydrogenase [Sphingomonas sp. AP4-R1]
MRFHTSAGLIALAIAAPACAQVNSGATKPSATPPFVVTEVTKLRMPWKIAFLPDGRMLITEKPGGLWIVKQTGEKTEVTGTPPVFFKGQAGMLGVFVSPHYAQDHFIYLTYSEPGDGGASLAVARAHIAESAGTAKIEGLQVIWRELPKGDGGQYGGVIAFAPDGRSMFLTVGERMRFTPAQDPDSPLGKILHLTLDGKPAPGNPGEGKTGAASVAFMAPPGDTEEAKTAPTKMVPVKGPNLAPAEIWASGIRTPYGLAFDKAGKLWEVEHGPRGGDELNLIEKGKNYGWPLVSYGMNYNGVPIPSPDTRPDLAKPVVYWVPVIGPGGLSFYDGKAFPEWAGSAFIGGMPTKSLVRVTFDGQGGAKEAERWDMGKRIRDVAVAPDGALWLLEDAYPGSVLKLTPKK